MSLVAIVSPSDATLAHGPLPSLRQLTPGVGHRRANFLTRARTEPKKSSLRSASLVAIVSPSDVTLAHGFESPHSKILTS